MKRLLPRILLLACLAFAVAIYFPGTTGYFLFDDTINIVENDLLRIQSLDFLTLERVALSGSTGSLGRPISVLSFALNYYFNGLSPYHFKLTNIAIHLVNGVLVYILTNLILKANSERGPETTSPDYRSWTSLAVSSAWLLHPLNLTGVLYIVQRMTSLAALFTFAGMITYLYGRQCVAFRRSGWIWILSSFLLFAPLATLSKENGALLPIFLLLIESLLFQFKTNSRLLHHTLIALFVLSVALPTVAAGTFLIAHPEWLSWGYQLRDFTLAERLMTEARVLLFYIQSIVAPNLPQLGIYHDDIPISKGILDPVTTLLSILALSAILFASVRWRKRYPLVAFGILFFLVGHSIESSFLALELAHEHRNYLPMYGVILPMFYCLLGPHYHVQSLRMRRILALGLVLAFASLTYARSTQWGDHRLMKEMAANNHPNSIRANADIGALYAAIPPTSQAQADTYYRRAYEYFRKASELSPSDTLGLFGLIALNLKYDLPVEESWVSVLASRMANHPISANTGNSIATLEKCVSAGNCALSAEHMDLILESALQNPKMQAGTRTQVLFARSNFLYKVREDRVGAIQSALKAAQASPGNIEARITLITLLINMNALDEAASQIVAARTVGNRASLHGKTLDELEKIVATRRSAK